MKLTVGLILAGLALQANSPASPATPLDPASAILDAFQTHRIVALGEPHGNEHAASFRLSLIRDSRFPAIVNDIVVESGSALYQDVIDRFTRGEAVDDEALRKIWQNTTQPHTVWDVPIYEQFFREVRAVNLKLPRPQQLRVLLGDPPIDWDRIDRGDDPKAMAPDGRTRSPFEVIRREVIAKGRRALVVYGGMHLRRQNVNNDTVVAFLERAGVSVFNVWASVDTQLEKLQPDVGSWPRPSLARIQGTTLGAVAFGTYISADSVTIQNAQALPPAPIAWRQLPMERQFDAVLYLGPPSSMTQSKLSPDLCADERYLTMRVNRLASLPVPPGAPSAVEQLKQYCASVTRKK